MIGCGLDDAALEAQFGRYRALAAHVVRAERRPAEVEVVFGDTLDRGLLVEAVAVERGCCPFFTIEQSGDRLTIGVDEPGREPALATVADALEAPSRTSGPRAAPR
jgi:hypothetical protein